MKEFNENPFKKDTPVVPFSNGTDAMVWQEMNCLKCKKYESESTDEEKAGCKLAFHLDAGFVIGDIPLWVAKEIGCTYDPLYGFVHLSRKCREHSTGDEPF